MEPRHGHFDEVLESIPDAAGKVILFFGGSLGNIETLADTVEFLRSMRERMTVHDRFLIGIDLHKDEEILRRAYEAGHANHAFFMNMLRRINNELDANFDLTAFEQESTYDRDEPYEGIENRCVNMKLATTVPRPCTSSASWTWKCGSPPETPCRWARRASSAARTFPSFSLCPAFSCVGSGSTAAATP
ncbi:MAG: L-histidine N(alpha)-methyltransferase [Polyangiaceae bacterium]|nr:L-histidine N(alpha)-methyltransferase [Polyangiaceae bacterium]